MWRKFTTPIIGLSPMDGVTDAPMRYITAKYGNPDLIFTEFVHVEGLFMGKLHLFTDLLYSSIERPIIAQIFGHKPKFFYKAAHIIAEMGFDGIDINMGCPADSIVKKGGGAGLIDNPKLAQEIIKETKRGIIDWQQGQTLKAVGLTADKIQWITNFRQHNQIKIDKTRSIPISIKTRIGTRKNTVIDWVKYLLEMDIDMLTIHGRTLKQLYSGLADWQAIASVSELVHRAGTLYLGNGDIDSRQSALEKIRQYNLDGVLIGRASFGNPWVFKGKQNISKQKKLTTALEHAHLHQKLKGDKRWNEIKKHLGWYCRGFTGAKQLRMQFMNSKNVVNIEEILKANDNLLIN